MNNNNSEKKTNLMPLAISNSENDKVALIYSVKVRTIQIIPSAKRNKK